MVGEARDAAGEGGFIVAVVKRSRGLLEDDRFAGEKSLTGPRQSIHGGDEEGVSGRKSCEREGKRPSGSRSPNH